MADFTNIAVIYNPNSTGESKEKSEELVGELREAGLLIPIELTPTEYAGHAIELAQQVAHASERPLIVSSSGDGGYNEVVNGALKAQAEGASPVCAVLPAGNANDHRRSVRRKPLSEAILEGEIDHIDVLKAGIESTSGEQKLRYAHSYIGVGLTPTIAVELNRNHLSRIKETWIVFKSLRDFHPVEVEVDGERLVVDSLIFANVSQMAKVLTIAENAEPDDGLFEVIVFPYKRKVNLFISLCKAAIQGLNGESCSRYGFRAVKDMPLQFDGEVLQIAASDTVHIGIASKALATIR